MTLPYPVDPLPSRYVLTGSRSVPARKNATEPRTSKGLTLSSVATFKRIGIFQTVTGALEALAKAEGVVFVNENAAA